MQDTVQHVKRQFTVVIVEWHWLKFELLLNTPHVFTHVETQIWCMSVVSAMKEPLLLFWNTIDELLSAEYRIDESFPLFSSHCVSVVHVSVLTFHLNLNIYKINKS